MTMFNTKMIVKYESLGASIVYCRPIFKKEPTIHRRYAY